MCEILILGTYDEHLVLALKLHVTEWYQRRVGHRNASLDRRVIFLKVISPLKLFLLYLSWRPLFSLPIFTCYLAFSCPLYYGKEFIDFFQTLSKIL
jgi:hypothetical protein